MNESQYDRITAVITACLLKSKGNCALFFQHPAPVV